MDEARRHFNDSAQQVNNLISEEGRIVDSMLTWKDSVDWLLRNAQP